MISDPALHLVNAIMAVLRNDKAVTDLVGLHIYEDQDHIHGVEAGIILGDTKARTYNSAAFKGQEHEITLHIYSPNSVRKISGAVINLLHDADLEVLGHLLVEMQFEWSETRFLKESKSYHCLMVFKALTVED